MEIGIHSLRQKCRPVNSVSGDIRFINIFATRKESFVTLQAAKQPDTIEIGIWELGLFTHRSLGHLLLDRDVMYQTVTCDA